MRHFLILTASLVSFNLSAQKTVTVSESKREVRFVKVEKHQNDGFWSRNQSITKLIVEAAEAGKLKAYSVNQKDGQTSLISTSDCKKKRIIPPAPPRQWKADKKYSTWASEIWYNGKAYDPIKKSKGVRPDTGTTYWKQVEPKEPPVEYYMTSQFDFFGLDVTYGTSKGKEVRQYNYINIYVPWVWSRSGTQEYLYSVKFDDVVQFLNSGNKLYAKNKWKGWFGGDVFVLGDNYVGDGFGTSMRDFALRNKSITFKDQDGNELDSTKNLDYKGRHRDFYGYIFIEENTKGQINSIEFEEGLSWRAKRKGETPKVHNLDWQEFLAAYEKTNSKKSIALKMGDALSSEKFKITEEKHFEPFEISTKGKFQDGKNDPICSNSLNVNTISKVKPIKSLYTYQEEELNLVGSKNAGFWTENFKLSDYALIKILESDLQAYSRGRDGVQKLSKDEVNDQIILPVESQKYKEGGKYYTGDIIKKDGKYFKVTQGNTAEEAEDWGFSGELELKPFNPDKYLKTDLKLVSFTSKVTFDYKGKKKKYNQEYMIIWIPADARGNLIGIQKLVAMVKWSDLKKHLIADGKSEIAEKIDSRDYRASFQWSDKVYMAD